MLGPGLQASQRASHVTIDSYQELASDSRTDADMPPDAPGTDGKLLRDRAPRPTLSAKVSESRWKAGGQDARNFQIKPGPEADLLAVENPPCYTSSSGGQETASGRS